MLLGCIGDDFTGSSDLANTLAKQGMRTVQYNGVPETDAAEFVEAGVVALKSRSIAVEDAIGQSLAALRWLQAQGCEQFFFKYCSTFDSTPKGNIGPVAEALAEALDARGVIVCPAFPGTGRTIYQGHLFVNGVLLNESGMENHPLTPMTDANLCRFLQLQTKLQVGYVGMDDVFSGEAAIHAGLQREESAGNRLIVVDALRDEDLMQIGAAADGLKLITGGSGVALGLPANFSRRGLISGKPAHWTGISGKTVCLSGSCSTATRAQIAEHKKSHPVYEIIASDVIEGQLSAQQVGDWLLENDDIPLCYSSADPDVVRAIQQQFGKERAAKAVEDFFAEVATYLIANGVRKLLVAGGETSGAVVEGLGLAQFELGPEIDPGVPVMKAELETGSDQLVIALKSGNFGAPDFFAKAGRKAANLMESDG